MTAVFDRIVPNALDSEKAVLGACIIDPDAFSFASEFVSAGDFYSPGNEAIFVSLTALYAKNLRVDKIAVAEDLRSRGVLEKIGGLDYLSAVMDFVATVHTVEYHARIVAEKAMLRRLIRAGAAITSCGFGGEDDSARALLDAETALNAVVSTQRVAKVETAYQVMDRLEQARRENKREDVFYSPWPGLNHALGGFMAGELIAWVAAPQIGKSGCASMVADYAAERYGAVILAALENGVDRTVQRLLALRTGISARTQRVGTLSESQRTDLELASYEYACRPFYVVGTKEAGSIASLMRLCRMVSRENKLATIIVDHASKLEDVSREQGKISKHERLSAAYERLIEIGQTFGCPVHVVQHFNREGQSSGVPTIASLGRIRDGGNLEGHADAIIMPHRDDPIGTEEERASGRFIIAKSRDGQGGEIPMRYDGQRNMWTEANAGGKAWFMIQKPSAA